MKVEETESSGQNPCKKNGELWLTVDGSGWHQQAEEGVIRNGFGSAIKLLNIH